LISQGVMSTTFRPQRYGRRAIGPGKPDMAGDDVAVV
jgi:hypothetical protein